eukprot:1158066-Pelagomonas_calceolata.AAC.4
MGSFYWAYYIIKKRQRGLTWWQRLAVGHSQRSINERCCPTQELRLYGVWQGQVRCRLPARGGMACLPQVRHCSQFCEPVRTGHSKVRHCPASIQLLHRHRKRALSDEGQGRAVGGVSRVEEVPSTKSLHQQAVTPVRTPPQTIPLLQSGCFRRQPMSNYTTKRSCTRRQPSICDTILHEQAAAPSPKPNATPPSIYLQHRPIFVLDHVVSVEGGVRQAGAPHQVDKHLAGFAHETQAHKGTCAHEPAAVAVEHEVATSVSNITHMTVSAGTNDIQLRDV